MNEWTRSQNEQFPWQIILVIGWSCKAEKKGEFKVAFERSIKKSHFWVIIQKPAMVFADYHAERK